MWSFLLVIFTQFANRIVARAIAVILSGLTITSMITAANVDNQSLITAFAFACAGIVVAISSLQHEDKFAYSSILGVVGFTALGLFLSEALTKHPVASLLCLSLLVVEFLVIRRTHMPLVQSLNDALERAEIFSTITKSSREFHSREPEEAIRNIVNVTKTLGYISVSVVSFDRRQKIFEDGVPIPNVMDIAVRASATRRVTITEDDTQTKNPRARQGDIVGVPIWINGRYSAALIVQTSSYVKVTQRDCEALELLADQAGRALENAGKAAMDRRVVERLTDESQRDKLTGLGNRRFADSMVASMKPGDVLAMVDLDGLKSTNDVHGHAAGDELLHEVGVFLSEQVRNPDMAARLGGDEFMILLRGANEGATVILERLLALWQDKKLYNTTFSIGMAIHRSDRTTHETVEASDDALYQAKKTGKNRLVCSTVS
jgi:diguanylate cyclase (GGDEF)-like protein